jgi:hypothetical protein
MAMASLADPSSAVTPSKTGRYELDFMTVTFGMDGLILD